MFAEKKRLAIEKNAKKYSAKRFSEKKKTACAACLQQCYLGQ